MEYVERIFNYVSTTSWTELICVIGFAYYVYDVIKGCFIILFLW